MDFGQGDSQADNDEKKTSLQQMKYAYKDYQEGGMWLEDERIKQDTRAGNQQGPVL